MLRVLVGVLRVWGVVGAGVHDGFAGYVVEVLEAAADGG